MCGLAATSVSTWRGFAQSPDSDTHDDFAPSFKAQPAASVSDQIQQDIKDHRVFVYMKVAGQRRSATWRCEAWQNVTQPADKGCVCRAIQKLHSVGSAIWLLEYWMLTVSSAALFPAHA